MDKIAMNHRITGTPIFRQKMPIWTDLDPGLQSQTQWWKGTTLKSCRWFKMKRFWGWGGWWWRRWWSKSTYCVLWLDHSPARNLPITVHSDVFLRHKDELLPEADRPYSLFEAGDSHVLPKWSTAPRHRQGLAGAVCFWVAALKAARGSSVNFPCYEAWVFLNGSCVVHVLYTVWWLPLWW